MQSLILTCGATTRRGKPCRWNVLFSSGRCRFHGGLSTGPRTPAGKARSLQAAILNLRLTPNWKKHMERTKPQEPNKD